jgi:hypothetical protein
MVGEMRRLAKSIKKSIMLSSSLEARTIDTAANNF